MNNNKYSVVLVNNSHLPFIIETWMSILNDELCGISVLESIIINKYEEITLYSLTGDWYISSLFTDETIKQIWQTNNLPLTTIGKFRSLPCISGNYSWINFDYINVNFNSIEQKMYISVI
jgi:hypothetical protein